MEFIPKRIEEYAEMHTSEGPQYLYELYRETHLNVLVPRMLSGFQQGRFLSFIAKMISPSLIVEIGTYTGYSALCMAEGLVKDGRLITLDINEELASIQQKYFQKSPYADKIQSVMTNAMTYMDQLPDNIDLVFIDADKENYLNYYQAILPKLNRGAYIIVDNVLWSGKVIDDPAVHDKETKSLVAFNKYVQADDQVENIMLAIRDGLTIVRKK